jgi:monoamine oxidase
MAKQARSCIVIGAGLAGLSAAYRLRKSGWTVTVLEALQRVGGRVSCLTLSKTRAHFSIRSTSKNIWNEIIQYLRSWLQSVSRIRSFHCHRMRSESESQFTCAAPVKSALP